MFYSCVAISSCETKGNLGNQRDMKGSGTYYKYGGMWYLCKGLGIGVEESRSLISLCCGVTSKENICPFKENGALFNTKGSFVHGPIWWGKWGGQSMLRNRGKGRANSPWLM